MGTLYMENDYINDIRLSDEIDENGQNFVLAQNGNTVFGEVKEESRLKAAPIKLSVGFQNIACKGYGLRHIEANHGVQIRNAGFASVVEFVEYVAVNFKRECVKKGKIRDGIFYTYIIYTELKNCYLLFIELSKDTSYWNVNSGGIFRRGYLLNKENVGTETEPPKSRSTTPE